MRKAGREGWRKEMDGWRDRKRIKISVFLDEIKQLCNVRLLIFPWF